MILKFTNTENKTTLFNSKDELFKHLRENKDIIIDAKKSVIQKSVDKNASVVSKCLDLLKFSDQLKGIKIDDNFYYIAVNSTLILDSHEDMHDNGIWKKSVQEIQRKNYLVCDHEMEILQTVARKEHIEIFTAKVPFSLIGQPYEGETEILVYKVPKNQIKIEAVKEWLDSGDSIEASVRMRYVTILLAMDSNNPEDATEKANYDAYINKIANRNDFEYIPYFFIIKEAQNVRESSLVVAGSNHATGQVQSSKQAEKSLDEIEAEQSLQAEQEAQKEQLKQLLKKLK